MQYLTKRQLYEHVEKCRTILRKRGITGIIYIEAICDKFPNVLVEYIPMKTKGLRGMVSLATNDSPENCILINSNLTKEERHFHSIHEFTHIYLHHREESKSFHCYDKIQPSQNSTLEWQANEGAAELLMPYKEFIPAFCKLFYLYKDKPEAWKVYFGNWMDVSDVLANLYDVTPIAVKNRISTLSYEIDQYQRGEAVENIQLLSYSKQKCFGISATNYVDIIAKISCRYMFALDWDSVIGQPHTLKVSNNIEQSFDASM